MLKNLKSFRMATTCPDGQTDGAEGAASASGPIDLRRYLRNWNQLTFTKSADCPLVKVRYTVCVPVTLDTLPGIEVQVCQPPVLASAKLPIGALLRLSSRTSTSPLTP